MALALVAWLRRFSRQAWLHRHQSLPDMGFLLAPRAGVLRC